MIKVTELIKMYGEEIVLNIKDININSGESFGLVGNNGAGKTTFFSLLLDLIRPSQGFVELQGLKVDSSEDWKSYTGSFLDESFLIDFLSPEEYFEFLAKTKNLNQEDLHLFYEKFSPLFNDEILNKKKLIRDLSKGNQKKVGIAAAFLGNPQIVILDEPFANLDPSSQIKLKSMLQTIRRENEVTILISSHDLNHVTEVSSRIAILEKGIIVQDRENDEETLKELYEYFSN